MHVEPPEGRIDSVKSFLGHYLMIVLSILTALGLEEWVQHMHRLESGRSALEQIEAEIHANLGDVRHAKAENALRRKPLDAWSERIAQALKDDEPTARIRSEIVADSKTVSINFAELPPLRHSAWDVAIANQSAAAIDPARLQKLSALYATQNEMLTAFQADLSFVNQSRFIDTLTDLELGAVEPREFLHMLGQTRTMLQESERNLAYLEFPLEHAVGVKHPPASGKSGVPPASSPASN